MSERSGLKAHRTLAPANARYASRQIMCGRKPSLERRERFCAANTMEIVAMAGQKILFSGRASNAWKSEAVTKIINGDIIKEKAQPKIGTTANLSIIALEDFRWSDVQDCIEVFDLLALYWRKRWEASIA
jgi:hypothetical protein